MEEHKDARVRFAPSPTGYLHVGSARTALFNWLFAKRYNGKLILRIEDTDLKRSQKKYLDEIIDSLKWLGLDWDEGPYFQSQRTAIYKEYAEKLVKEGKAHYEDGAIRFKVPPEKIKLHDLVHKEIDFDNSLLGDFIIVKSDGMPTYNFACVVDDAQLGITHVIRGDDHIPNTPKQIAIYHALGLKEPKFVHIPLILGMDRSKLSKRHGAVAIAEYRKEGFLPEALFNFMSLLGWSPGGNRELMSKEEIAAAFSIKNINKVSAVFDYEKLKWMNSQHIKKMADEKLLDLVMPYLKSKKYVKEGTGRAYLLKLVNLFRGRMKLMSEFPSVANFFFLENVKYDDLAVLDYLKKAGVAKNLALLKDRLSELEAFDKIAIEQAVRGLATELEIEAADLIHPTRVALTGKSVSPGLFDIIELLGKEKVIKRISRAIKAAKMG